MLHHFFELEICALFLHVVLDCGVRNVYIYCGRVRPIVTISLTVWSRANYLRSSIFQRRMVIFHRRVALHGREFHRRDALFLRRAVFHSRDPSPATFHWRAANRWFNLLRHKGADRCDIWLCLSDKAVERADSDAATAALFLTLGRLALVLIAATEYIHV